MAAPRVTLSTLLGDAVIYGLPRFAQMLMSVLLLPLYTRYFAVAEYGIIENLNILAVLLTWAVGLALPSSVVRFYTVADSLQERVSIVTSAAAATTAMSGLTLLAMALLGGWLGQLFLHLEPARGRPLIILVTAWVATLLPLSVCESVFQARFQRRQYLVSTLGSVVVSVAITALCLVQFRLGVVSVFLGAVLGHGLLMVYAVYNISTEFRISAFHVRTLRRLLAFSLPLVPAALALLAIRSADRYFIIFLLPDPLHQVGLYSMAEKLMGPLTLLGAAFTLAWSPFAMAASLQDNAQLLYLRAFKHYVALTSVAIVALCAAAPLLLRILATPPYYESVIYMPPLGLYLALNSLYHLGALGFMLTNRTVLMVPMVLAAALVNAVLNLLWIPPYGVSGAAWATVVTFLIYNGALFLVGDRLCLVGFPLATGLTVYALAIPAAYLALYFPLFGPLLVAAHIGLLLVTGFLELQGLTRHGHTLLRGPR